MGALMMVVGVGIELGKAKVIAELPRDSARALEPRCDEAGGCGCRRAQPKSSLVRAAL